MNALAYQTTVDFTSTCLQTAIKDLPASFKGGMWSDIESLGSYINDPDIHNILMPSCTACSGDTYFEIHILLTDDVSKFICWYKNSLKLFKGTT